MLLNVQHIPLGCKLETLLLIKNKVVPAIKIQGTRIDRGNFLRLSGIKIENTILSAAVRNMGANSFVLQPLRFPGV